MMRWLPYALACAIFLAAADFFIKLATNKIASSMGMFVYGATTFTAGLIWVTYLRVTGQSLLITRPGLLYAIAAGIAHYSCDGHRHSQFARRPAIARAIYLALCPGSNDDYCRSRLDRPALKS